MLKYMMSSVKLTIVMIVLCAVLYPLFIAAVGRLAPGQGKGETVEVNGKVVGYAKIGQSFTKDEYFQGRPSAVGYNAAGSAGSNKGPSNPDYLKTVQDRIDTFLVHNPGIYKRQIPAELVTASGSGLDPDISPASAAIQVNRISILRHIPQQKLNTLIAEHTVKPLFGPQKINVLQLNIALDQIK
ncbi:K+-transporting ATPase ATPase C chain [Filimonas lacunae]|uniref:Potassium-transporting ATPase KdpC subunit n=1 Tax=Filimonas lacunae TaxID=477680 RepID=A0A173MHZ0_9BACT|nr:K(+)-transporting ATPase subunit C [Filimonas lacunae]BAV07215.1 potassium-transporting ATPase C chain [Filimonas lacunae]SIS93155.1 K+-transporting ATPase ATPase C chain [Filimonas lacunae]